MAAEDKPSMEVPLRTAQGVSRFFLFEALRTGCEDIQTQHGELQSARDKAEGLLVKGNTKDFESLLQGVLTSCAKSLQTHASIVEAIAETLSADADQSLDAGGVKAPNKYSLLVGQIKDAAASVEQLRNINAKKEKSPTIPNESDFDSAPEVQSSKKPNAIEPEQPTPRKKAKTKHASSTSASVTEAPSSDSMDEKPMKGKGKKLGRPPKPSKSSKAPSSRASPELGSPAPPSDKAPKPLNETEKPIKALAEKLQADEASAEASKDSNLADVPQETPIPAAANRRASIEDITSEVNARLAAKELKRARKKESKKRKRDSLASEIFSPDRTATPEHAAPLPPKKKARVELTKSDSKGKRQNVGDVPGGKGKMKKQKTQSAAVEEAATVPERKPSFQESKNAAVDEKLRRVYTFTQEKNGAKKAKRRRSSDAAETSIPIITQVAAPEANNRKKRRIGS